MPKKTKKQNKKNPKTNKQEPTNQPSNLTGTMTLSQIGPGINGKECVTPYFPELQKWSLTSDIV